MEQTETGAVPADDGWFILNLAEIGWERIEGNGTWCSFEAPSSRSPLLGIGVHVLWPGQAPGSITPRRTRRGSSSSPASASRSWRARSGG